MVDIARQLVDPLPYLKDLAGVDLDLPQCPAALHRRGPAGWPRILILNRPFAAARRERVLRDVPVVDGYDRDEYPPAVGRGRGPRLTRGTSPKGRLADIDHVDSSQNRSHGARLGIKLRRFCDSTRFRYVFY